MKHLIMITILLGLAMPAVCKPVSSLVAGKNTEMTETSLKWTNPYITDGLVAMWDGEWNAGWGVHDENAIVWKDLTGNGHDWSMTDNYSWGENHLNITGKCGIGNWIIPYQFSTSETVVSVSKDGVCILMEAYTINSRPRQSIAMKKQIGRVGINNYYHRGAVWADLTNKHSYSITATEAFQDGISQPATDWDWFGTGSTTQSLLGGEIVNTVYNFKGQCYNIRIYNRYLSNEEIAHNYAIDKERFGL